MPGFSVVLVGGQDFALRAMQIKMPDPKKTGPGVYYLVAGARYENYMQIPIEPFPLVA